MCLAQGSQPSDTGEARTRGPSVSIKHSTTEPLRSLKTGFSVYIISSQYTYIICIQVSVSVCRKSIQPKCQLWLVLYAWAHHFRKRHTIFCSMGQFGLPILKKKTKPWNLLSWAFFNLLKRCSAFFLCTGSWCLSG